MKKFNSTLNKGFNMTFANGITASVQWGTGNYCDNHFSKDFSFSKEASSNTAEVAAWVTNKLYDTCDDVAGYLSPDEVLRFLNNCANYKTA
mgnify:CR=1 FL=1